MIHDGVLACGEVFGMTVNAVDAVASASRGCAPGRPAKKPAKQPAKKKTTSSRATKKG